MLPQVALVKVRVRTLEPFATLTHAALAKTRVSMNEPFALLPQVALIRTRVSGGASTPTVHDENTMIKTSTAMQATHPTTHENADIKGPHAALRPQNAHIQLTTARHHREHKGHRTDTSAIQRLQDAHIQLATTKAGAPRHLKLSNCGSGPSPRTPTGPGRCPY